MIETLNCLHCDDEVIAGDDYMQHLQIIHEILDDYEEILILTRAKMEERNKEDNSNADELSGESFIKIFNTKLQEIKDMAEGKLDSVSVNFDQSETTVVEEKQLWEMFENIKSKILNLDLSAETQADNVVDSLGDVEETETKRRWFEGSYYICNKCDQKEYGETAFKVHLKRNHGVVGKSIRDLSDFYSNYVKKHYSCKVCNTSITHDYSRLYQHLKRKHFISIVDYERDHEANFKATEETEEEEDGKIPAPAQHLMNTSKVKNPTVKLKSIKIPSQSLEVAIKSTSNFSSLKIPSPSLEVSKSTTTLTSLKILSPSLINERKYSDPMDQVLIPTLTDDRIDDTSIAENENDENLDISDDEMTSTLQETSIPIINKNPPSPPPPTFNKNPPAAQTSAPSVEVTKVVASSEEGELIAIKREPMEQRIKKKTLYYCPLKMPGSEKPCDFNITKDGFTNGAAAKHLKHDHSDKVIKDMKPGQLKFKKVKVRYDSVKQED